MTDLGGLPELKPAKRADVLTAEFETELVVLVPEQRTASTAGCHW